MASSGKLERESVFSGGSVLAVLKCVVQTAERLEPPLDARVMVPHFAGALERLVIPKRYGTCSPNVVSKTFEGSGNAASFQAERIPAPLGIERSAAYTSNGPH